MATPVATVRAFVRAILLDQDNLSYAYSDEILDSQINWTLVELNRDDLQIDGVNFTTDLTRADQAVVAIKTALNIIVPQDDNFSYKTAVLSVSRKGGNSQLYAHWNERLTNLLGGRFVFAVDQDLTAFFNDIERTLGNISESISLR